jgi:adenylylsulfate kinase-like enzyme
LAPPCRVMFETMGRAPIWLVGMMGAGKSAVGPLLVCSLARDASSIPTSRKEFGFEWR